MRKVELYLWALVFALILNGQSIQPPPAHVSTGNYSGTLPSFADAETPAGLVDGSNAVFAIAHPPNAAASLILSRNGLILQQGGDYALSGALVIFASEAKPQPGDLLLCWYRY